MFCSNLAAASTQLDGQGGEMGRQLRDLHHAESLIATRSDCKDWSSCFPAHSPYELDTCDELQSEESRVLSDSKIPADSLGDLVALLSQQTAISVDAKRSGGVPLNLFTTSCVQSQGWNFETILACETCVYLSAVNCCRLLRSSGSALSAVAFELLPASEPSGKDEKKSSGPSHSSRLVLWTSLGLRVSIDSSDAQPVIKSPILRHVSVAFDF